MTDVVWHCDRCDTNNPGGTTECRRCNQATTDIPRPGWQYRSGTPVVFAPQPTPPPKASVVRKTRWPVAVSVVLAVAVGGVVVANQLTPRQSAAPVAPPSSRSAPPSTSEPTTPAQPVTPVKQETAPETLTRLRTEDHTRVEGEFLGSWVPQLASETPGIDAKGRSWDPDSILLEHRSLRQSYGALLLKSEDVVSKKSGYWISFAPVRATTASEILSWCGARSLDNDHCFAKLITHDTSIKRTVEYQPG